MAPKKQRSPSHPTLDIETAISKARLIHTSYSTAAVHREVLSECMGYSPNSGPALQALASLGSYGLLTRHGKGEAGVSEEGLELLFPDSESEFAKTAAIAMMRPPVFASIAERFSGIPAEAGVAAHLTRSLGFTVKGAEKAAAIYARSLRYIEGLSDGERSEIADETPQNSSPADAAFRGEEDNSMTQARSIGEYREIIRSPLLNGNAFRLMGKREFSVDDWQDIRDEIDMKLKRAQRGVRDEATALEDLADEAPA